MEAITARRVIRILDIFFLPMIRTLSGSGAEDAGPVLGEDANTPLSLVKLTCRHFVIGAFMPQDHAG
jgi:hypothetical protein